MSLNDKKQKLMDELENEKEQIKRSTEEMSAELKRLLESEIKVFHQRTSGTSDDAGGSWAHLCEDGADHVQPS